MMVSHVEGILTDVPSMPFTKDIDIDNVGHDLSITPETKEFEEDNGKKIHIFWGKAVENGVITVLKNGYIYTNKGKTGVTVDPVNNIVKATMNLNKNKTPNDFDIMRLSTLAAMAWLHLQKNHNIKWN